MKFLISLALIVVLASAHDYGSMFKPARSCEQDPEQVAEKTESMLNQLQEVVSKVCNKDGSSEDSESENVEATLLALEEAVDGELEEEEKDMEMGDKRDKVERGRHFDGVVEFLTEEKCAQDVATVAQELLEKFQQEKEARDPCNKSVTFAEFQTQITERCEKDSEKDGDFVKDEDKDVEDEDKEVDNGEDVVKDEDKEVVVDDGEEKEEVVKDEEEVVAGTLGRDGMEKGEGKGDRKDKESRDCVKLTEEELTASWTSFFTETEDDVSVEIPVDDAVSGVQFELGVRKMKVMNDLKMAYKSNCVKPEVEDKPVEGEEETVKDEEKEAETTGFQRRSLYRDGRPGDRHGERDAEKQWGDKRGEHSEEKQWLDRHGENDGEKQWEDKHGEKDSDRRGGDRHGERDGEKKENPAMELVAAFKTECRDVTYKAVNDLFDEVQAVLKTEKVDREQENQDKETEKDESELVADKETEKDEAEVVAEKETEQKEDAVSVLADVSDAQEKLDEAVAREVDVSQEKSEQNSKREEKFTDMRSFRQEMMRRWEEMRAQREAADKDVDSEGKTEEKTEEEKYLEGRERGEKSDENKSEEKSQGSRRERQRRSGNSRRFRFQWGRRKL